jgi:predicted HicB family RNase H-like nuclease
MSYKKYTERIEFTLSEGLKSALKEASLQQGVSVAEFIRTLLWLELSKEGSNGDV